jgi:hypothetical protein
MKRGSTVCGELNDPTCDLPGGDPSVDQVAGSHFVSGAEQSHTVGQKGQAVPAGEDGEGAQRLKARSEPGDAVPAGDEVVLKCLTGALGQLIEAIACVMKLAQAGQSQAVGEAVKVEGNLARVGHAEFAGFAGGKRTSVGGQIGEGHVDFVANSRDDRQA